MIRSLKSLVALGAFAVAAHGGTIYNLSSNFSTSSNPNGTWSFLTGTSLGTATALTAQMPFNNGNPLYFAASSGYWGFLLQSSLSMKTKTVFVLGAGASAPFGFPIGLSWAQMIYDQLNPAGTPHPTFRVLTDLGHTFPHRISQLPQSILSFCKQFHRRIFRTSNRIY